MIGETLVRMLRTFPQEVCTEAQFRLLFLKEMKGADGSAPAQRLPRGSESSTPFPAKCSMLDKRFAALPQPSSVSRNRATRHENALYKRCRGKLLEEKQIEPLRVRRAEQAQQRRHPPSLYI